MIKLNIGCGAVYVCVESNGKLEEYDVKGSQDTARQECYIASEADQPFSVRVVASGESLIDQRADVYLDGVWVRGVILRAGVPLTTNLASAILTNNLQSVERSFVFGKMKLKEDDSSSDEANSGISADLGTIRVELQAITIGVPQDFANVPTSLPGDEAISEKAKKAGAHTARFGEARPVAYQGYTSTTRLVYWPKHEVVFRYAPLDFLYAREVIRRPQASSASTSSDVKSHIHNRPYASGSGSRSGVKVEKGWTKDESQQAEGSSSRKRTSDVAQVVDISSEDEDEDDTENDVGLTAEERAELARLNAKRRANIRQGKQTQVKKAKLEHDVEGPGSASQTGYIPGEVIVISDDDSDSD